MFTAIDWLFKEGEMTIPCAKLSVAVTFLSKLKDVRSSAHFSVVLINSLGLYLHEDFRDIFAQQVSPTVIDKLYKKTSISNVAC